MGTFVNVYFFLPFLYQAYHREQLYEYLPSLIYVPLDNIFMIFGIDIQYELRMMGSAITGLLGSVQPVNDIFLLMIIYLTDRSSFLGDPYFFQLVTAYVPLVLTALSWIGTQEVAVWTNILYNWPISEMIMDTITFIYMIWPTVLVSAYNFL